ncbi:ubiquitin-hydrolase Zn-finger-containing protein [Actinocorallia herbida]|uniref:Ubiquitin-hydrolase Zn-finger-containing protein n=1 Tax=Actinocorallia herbida TaxID=58109 RepID=A0A3N1CZD3_9ACTN|nr:ubiquitin-hydrolase Zn-finger-containing protein [Actinocorallia herbida]
MRWRVAADERYVPTDRSCVHVDDAAAASVGTARGCDGCARAGTRWVHLRECLTCGHVGCCDTSPWGHARAHFAAHGHPLVRSTEPGEKWGWCFHDEVFIVPS